MLEVSASSPGSGSEFPVSAIRLQVPSTHEEHRARFEHLVALGNAENSATELKLRLGPGDLKKLVVFKRLSAESLAAPEIAPRFSAEARLAMCMNHPNVVHTYDTGIDATGLYLVREYLEGETYARLRTRLDESERVKVALVVLSEALSALEYAHSLKDVDGRELGVVHRSLSPENIFVTYDGQIKLLNFGVAADLRVEECSGKSNAPYMSPEQVRGETIDATSDLYALGAMLWEASTDGPPDVVAQICKRALEPRASDRFASASEFREAIEQLLAMLFPNASSRRVGSRARQLFEKEALEQESLIAAKVRSLAVRSGTLAGLGPLSAVRDPEDEAASEPTTIRVSIAEPEPTTRQISAPIAPSPKEQFFISTYDNSESITAERLEVARSARPENLATLESRQSGVRTVATVVLVCAAGFVFALFGARLFAAPPAPEAVAESRPARAMTKLSPLIERTETEAKPKVHARSEEPTDGELPSTRALDSADEPALKKRAASAAKARTPTSLVKRPIAQQTTPVNAKVQPSLDIDRDIPWSR